MDIENTPVWRFSLTRRILAVNLLTLALLAGGFFYLNNYRARLLDARLRETSTALVLLDDALRVAPPGRRLALLDAFGSHMQARIRYYDRHGRKRIDSHGAVTPLPPVDPTRDSWRARMARTLDRMVDFVAGAREPPRYVEPAIDRAAAWPEIVAAPGRAPGTGTANGTGRGAKPHDRSHAPVTMVRFAPDRTPLLTAALARREGGWLLISVNAREITHTVRDERFRFAVVLLWVGLAGALLSMFLARTIVRPLRRLALAAIRVRLGRSREVTVPRLPDRRDEIGLLARALSDMSQALRQRIDSGEAFAADVTHELKNPLASLSSAVQSLGRIEDSALRAQLLAIAEVDVQRLSRLIGEIGEASRMDAELSKTQFASIDLAALATDFARAYQLRRGADGPAFHLSIEDAPLWIVGDARRLERVLVNLVDNAESFAGTSGNIWLTLAADGGEARLGIEDDGPGVPAQLREKIFDRFHSLRHDPESFGQHSGLGLAIVRTIIAAHEGSVVATDRPGGLTGAYFLVKIPLLRTVPA